MPISKPITPVATNVVTHVWPQISVKAGCCIDGLARFVMVSGGTGAGRCLKLVVGPTNHDLIYCSQHNDVNMTTEIQGGATASPVCTTGSGASGWRSAII